MDGSRFGPPSTSRKKKRQPWGKQTVTGQITGIEGDFVMVLVLKAQITENNFSSELRTHKVGSTIKKKRQTLLKGNPERLHWSKKTYGRLCCPNYKTIER